MRKVFVSYSHKQGEWVRDRLVTVLKAGGAEVLIDVTRFQAGIAVPQQMDGTQDLADIHLLVLSPDYLSSPACVHEMERAIATDPSFARGSIVPVVRVPCTMPAGITIPDPLRVKLDDDSKSGQWDLLMTACGADLGAAVPHWLECLESVQRFLSRKDSVHLRVIGTPKWRELLDAVDEKFPDRIGCVDLNSGSTVSRPHLVAAILTACGHNATGKGEPDDLEELQTRIGSSNGAMLALRHFDRVLDPDRKYGDAFFWALNHLVETRKLCLLIESRASLSALVPRALQGSSLVTNLQTVELRASKP